QSEYKQSRDSRLVIVHGAHETDGRIKVIVRVFACEEGLEEIRRAPLPPSSSGFTRHSSGGCLLPNLVRQHVSFLDQLRIHFSFDLPISRDQVLERSDT